MGPKPFQGDEAASLHRSQGFSVRVSPDFDEIDDGDGTIRRFAAPEAGADDAAVIEFTASGAGTVIWPNREGESFTPAEAARFLSWSGLAETGLHLTWPGTASFPGAIFVDIRGAGVMVSKPEDPAGRSVEVRLLGGGEDSIILRLTGGEALFYAVPFDSREKLLRKGTALFGVPGGLIDQTEEGMGAAAEAADSAADPPTAEDKRRRGWNRQFQLGFIHPDGRSEIPEGRGFGILEDMARRFTEIGGVPGDIIHLFAYGEGHDRGYPDYTPSSRLGGPKELRRVVRTVKKMGYEVSIYLNARLADPKMLARRPNLTPGIITDPADRPVEEVYEGNRLVVMNPLFPPWQEEIFRWAAFLRSLGADWVQLDQVAGRRLPLPPGTEGGRGYREMIERIRAAGGKVWIQGVCGYYPANRYEMTHRKMNILADGELKGGNPLGVQNPLPALLFTGEGEFLVPAAKAELLDPREFPRVTVDMLGAGAVPPIYGGEYLEELAGLKPAAPDGNGVDPSHFTFMKWPQQSKNTLP